MRYEITRHGTHDTIGAVLCDQPTLDSAILHVALGSYGRVEVRDLLTGQRTTYRPKSARRNNVVLLRRAAR